MIVTFLSYEIARPILLSLYHSLEIFFIARLRLLRGPLGVESAKVLDRHDLVFKVPSFELVRLAQRFLFFRNVTNDATVFRINYALKEGIESKVNTCQEVVTCYTRYKMFLFVDPFKPL